MHFSHSYFASQSSLGIKKSISHHSHEAEKKNLEAPLAEKASTKRVQQVVTKHPPYKCICSRYLPNLQPIPIKY